MRQFLVAATLLALLPLRSAHAETHEFRIATLAPSGSPWTEILDKAAAEIDERTEHRVKISYYTGGQQGDEKDYIRKIKIGQLDGAAITAAGLAMIDPSILVLNLPMLFENQDEIDYVANKMWPYFQKKFEAKGFRLAERGEVGWIYFFSKNKVTSLDDLRKQKIPTLAGDDSLGSSLIDKLKLNGVPLGIPEIDAALTSGKIDSCFSSPLGAIALQWYTKVKYMAATPMVFAIGATVFSLDSVKKVSAEDQKTIEAIAKQSQKKARAVIRKANADALKTLERKGVVTVEVPKKMVDELTEIGASVQKEMTGKVYSKEELEMVIKYRDEYRAKHPKK
ncbi:MAG TPA: TRAP transporter substrate-binding protein DctP [Kofleriaceae bacterium]|jgi:TRAP-type C4-dicarboxylate transport system substrate-binding protein|nr:TRAP transporter substrate-binding protein DctP [Kofleriaceae bacterium]